MSECDMSTLQQQPLLQILVGGKDVATRFLAEELRRTIGDGAVLIDVAMMRCSLVQHGDISHFVVSGFEDVTNASFARKQLSDLTALASKCGAGLILVIKGGGAIDLLGLEPENVSAMVLVDGKAGPDGSFRCAAGSHHSLQATLQEIYAMLSNPEAATDYAAAGWGQAPRASGAIMERFKSPQVQNDFGWFMATVILALVYGATLCDEDWAPALSAFISATALNLAPIPLDLNHSSGFRRGLSRGAFQFAVALAASSATGHVMSWIFGAPA